MKTLLISHDSFIDLSMQFPYDLKNYSDAQVETLATELEATNELEHDDEGSRLADILVLYRDDEACPEVSV